MLSRLIKPASSRALSCTPALQFHISSRSEKSDVAADAAVAEPGFITRLMNRSAVTAEVTVSKLFPAGCGWQGASIVAENMGFEATDLGFFAITGAGDAMGVGMGHIAYFGIKKAVYDPSIIMAQQAQTALLLATATFFSGTAWQPIVGALQAHNCGFVTTALGTGAVCGSMFFAGLRVGRTLYSGMTYVDAGNSDNLIADAQLSAAIGGATAAFVGTDVSFGDDNFLRGVVGIEETASNAGGIATAGLSTALGFSVTQTAQNLAAPGKSLWLD